MRERTMFLLLICLWPTLALGQRQSATPEKPKLAKLLSVDKNMVYAKGLWRPDNPTTKNELMEAVTE